MLDRRGGKVLSGRQLAKIDNPVLASALEGNKREKLRSKKREKPEGSVEKGGNQAGRNYLHLA